MRQRDWFSIPGENKVLQLGWALLRDVLCTVGRITEGEFHRIYLKHSDLGETTFEILQARQAEVPMTLAAIDSLFHALVVARGPRAKAPVLIQTLERCSAMEAKFLVKIFTGDLRIGLKDGLVEEAIARAFDARPGEVREAHLLLGSVGETARLAKQNKLATASIVAFRPIKFMLASPEATATAIWERMQTAASFSQSAGLSGEADTP